MLCRSKTESFWTELRPQIWHDEVESSFGMATLLLSLISGLCRHRALLKWTFKISFSLLPFPTAMRNRERSPSAEKPELCQWFCLLGLN